MPVQSAVGKHHSSVTRLHAQQFIGTIKPRVGQSTGVLAKSAKEERGIAGEERRRPDPTPPDIRGLFDDLVCFAKLRLGDSLNHCHERLALALDIRP